MVPLTMTPVQLALARRADRYVLLIFYEPVSCLDSAKLHANYESG